MRAVCAVLFLVISASPGLVHAQITPASGVNTKVMEVQKVLSPKDGDKAFLLKLDNYYVFYTNPIAPYVNRQGSVMVPLKAFIALVGGELDLNEVKHSALINWRNSQFSEPLEFRANSTTVNLGKRSLQVATAPIWLPQFRDLLIPLKPIAVAMNMSYEWNAARTILTLRGFDAESSDVSFLEEALPEGYKDSLTLIPSNFSLRRVLLATGPNLEAKSEQYQIQVHLNEATNAHVKAGEQGLFMLVKFQSGNISYGGRDTLPSLDGAPASVDPCIKSRSYFKCNQFFQGRYKLEYIVARVRVRDLP